MNLVILYSRMRGRNTLYKYLKRRRKMEKICKNCKFWDDYVNEWGTCNNKEILEKIDVGHDDDCDFYFDFGCNLWEEK